ncbi:hypothetical protein L7F22_011919 [Adiantum nelumboides]|nr:hypothetical protein [Adiantum nelumboides]
MHYFAGLLRCGKSCRLRWINYLRPDLKRGNITEEEDNLIIKLHSVLGNRWSLIAGRLPGRTDNEIKNYWNTHLKKKLKGMGVNPNTHQPLATSPSSSSLNVSPPTSSCNAQHQKLLISNNEVVAMPGASCSMRRYSQLAANLQNHKLDGHEKSRMLIKSSTCTIDKYEIDRFLSSTSAPISNVISSSTHFDYKAKPMFSLDCTAPSSAASAVSDTCGAAAATALVRVGSGSSFINIQARRTAAPLVGASAAASSTPTCCSRGSSSSSISSSPISKKACGSLDQHPQYPYTLSPPLRSVVTPTPLSEFQASTKNPSSIHAFTQSPILYSSAQASTVHSTNAPLLESTHVINPSPITTYISSHSSHPATYTKSSSPIRGKSIDSPSSNNFVCPSSSSFDVRSTNLAAYKLLYSDEADFMKNAWSSGDETLPRSPSEVLNEGAGAFAKISAAMGLNASTSLVTSNIACTSQVVAEQTLCDQYMGDVITRQMATSAALRMVAPPTHINHDQNREVNRGHDQFHDVMEEGAELSNVAEKCLGDADIMMSSTSSGEMELSSDDVMWDFEMGLQQSLEEGGHNIIGADDEGQILGAAGLDSQLPITPTHQAEQLLQGAHALWGPNTCNMSSSSCAPWPLHMSSDLPPQYHDHQQQQQLADYKPPKLIDS